MNGIQQKITLNNALNVKGMIGKMKKQEAIKDLRNIIIGMILGIATSILLYTLLYYTEPQIEPLAYSIDFDTFSGIENTGSMLPTIKFGDEVLYQEYNFSINIGDLYVYDTQVNDTLILHRLIAQYKDLCFFKGDNNPYVDPVINCSQIKRKVIAIIESEAWFEN